MDARLRGNDGFESISGKMRLSQLTNITKPISSLQQEISRRRTFAIFSHPDVGKTTLTEKLLWFGGAIQVAGEARGRKASRHATSKLGCAKCIICTPNLITKLIQQTQSKFGIALASARFKACFRIKIG